MPNSESRGGFFIPDVQVGVWGEVPVAQDPSLSVPEEREGEVGHNCAIVGVRTRYRDPVTIAHTMLYDLQHRGHEGAGMVAISDKYPNRIRKGMGWVKHVFDESDISYLRETQPHIVVGQNRYSTQGTEAGEANQPFEGGGLTLAHNGTISNGEILKDLVLQKGLRGPIYSDSYLVHQWILQQNAETWEERIAMAMGALEPSHSLILSGGGKLFGVRDYMGVRPLVIGELGEGKGHILASETNVFQNTGAKMVREVEPGEGVMIDDDGIHTFFRDDRRNESNEALCAFEYDYISHVTGLLRGRSVYGVRKELGSRLAERDQEEGFMPDIVVPMQYSGLPYAAGYAKKIGAEIDFSIAANSYVGRVFIRPKGENGDGRDVASRRKHIGDPFSVEGKVVVVIDDSIVRGNALEQVRFALTEQGRLMGIDPPKEIHLRSGAPPVIGLCPMGVDMAESVDELLAVVQNQDERKIAQLKGFDSVKYNSNRAHVEAITGEKFGEGIPDEQLYKEAGLCGGCFTGKYPVRTDLTLGKFE